MPHVPTKNKQKSPHRGKKSLIRKALLKRNCEEFPRLDIFYPFELLPLPFLMIHALRGRENVEGTKVYRRDLSFFFLLSYHVKL